MDDLRRIGAFLDMMSAERGAARNTLDAYARDLETASAALSGTLCQAVRAELAGLLRDWSDEALAPATVARRLSVLRRFFRFLHAEGDRQDDPTAILDTPAARRLVPDVLSRQDLAQLIEAAGDDARLTCLVELLYGAGLRASELVALPMEALPRRLGSSWDRAELVIRGKGGAERICPLGSPALAALARWLEVRETFLPADPDRRNRAGAFVFPSRGAGGHLTRRRLGQMLDALAREAGLDPARVHPHALRHAYATHLLQGGADLRSVQTLLGHADITTTQIYTHVLTDELADLLAAAHPMAQTTPPVR
mgnify:CR=1 FL=1